MNPPITPETLYFKITNRKENHNDFQYCDGLNILVEEFNNDPNSSCVKGGFYFTTKEFIHEFYGYGVYLRVIELPVDDIDFKMVKDPKGDKYRANKIILKERYSLGELETYHKFGIKYPTLHHGAENGHLEVVKYLVENGADIHANNDHALRWSARFGHLEVVKYLIEKGGQNARAVCFAQ